MSTFFYKYFMTHFPIKMKPNIDLSLDNSIVEYDNVITKDMADSIIQFALNDDSFHRRGSKNAVTKASFTTCLLYDLTHPAYDVLDKVWKIFTDEHGYSLDFIEYYEIKEYRTGDSFGMHMDSHGSTNLNPDRKLNLIVQLSESEDYEGGDLYIKMHHATRNIGSAIFFPPHYLHAVTEITSGTRYCIIGHGWGVLNRK